MPDRKVEYTEMIWQHITPQRDLNHEIKPLTLVRGKPVCLTCHKRVKPVAKNEGPEALKALLRF